MVLVIGEGFVNLRASNVRKTVRYRIDRFAVLQQANHIMNTDPRAFDPRIATTNALGFDDVTIIGRRFHFAKYITRPGKVDIVMVDQR